MIDKKLIEDFSKLSGGDNEEFRDDVIDILIEKNADMSQQERNVMLHFVKGHHGENVISTVLDIINRADPNAINQLSDKYLKPRIIAAPPPKIQIDQPNKNLLDRINDLSRAIKTDLVEDLLSILSEDELKKYFLTRREKKDIFQLVKGHYNPASLFNALQVVIRVLEERKWENDHYFARTMNKELRFGVELVPATGLDKLVDYGRKFEVGGIDNIWITDHYTNMDPYITLTLIARATSTAQLGVGVTNPYIRHLASTASAIASLDRVSNNRMILGIGAGDKSTLAALNIEPQKVLSTVRETVKAIRLLWSNKNVNFSGQVVKLKDARLNFKPDRNIPIYIGAQGPNMLKLAGEIGNGILINASHELDFRIAKKMILEGVKKTKKSIKDLDLVAYTCFSTSENANDARKATIQVVAFIAAATPPNVLERHDLKVEKALKMKEFLVKGQISKAFQLVDNTYIDAFSIAGTPQQCINKIENLKNAGVTQFVFGSPLGPKKGKAMNLIIEAILKTYNYPKRRPIITPAIPKMKQYTSY